ncbi:hypothetical protein HID58_067619, partial [Brassica napus]
EVDDLIVKSKTSWLSAEEICKYSNKLRSMDAAPKAPLDCSFTKLSSFTILECEITWVEVRGRKVEITGWEMRRHFLEMNDVVFGDELAVVH